jgi:SAM-dependent methyltransferase
MPFAQILLVLFNICIIGFLIYLIKEVLQVYTVPPFIRTRSEVTDEIAGLIGGLKKTLRKGSSAPVVYDLGCGDGRVLMAIRAHNLSLGSENDLQTGRDSAQYIGIEKKVIPYILAKMNTGAAKNVTIFRRDIFKTPLHDATHIYTYLYNNVMDTLLPKLEVELTPGTILYSLDFVFSKKEPTHVYALKSAKKGKLGGTLYEYKF